MSIGHRLEEDEIEEATTAECFKVLGDEDTPRLYAQPYRLDVEHDVATGGGNSTDRRTVFIDQDLYEEVMDGEFKATGLEPDQIIRLWCDHEHGEVSVSVGDNPMFRYTPCHKVALCKEHLGVDLILGPGQRKKYEDIIWPGLMRCYNKKIVKPPPELWCEPYLDDSTERDKEILAIYRKLGVVDAFKYGKAEVEYGYAVHTCDSCRFWDDTISQERGSLRACKLVSGLERDVHGCREWMKLKKAS